MGRRDGLGREAIAHKGATEETNFQGKEKTNMGGLQNATLSDTDTYSLTTFSQYWGYLGTLIDKL